MPDGKYVVFNRGKAPFVLSAIEKGGKNRILSPGGSLEIETEAEFNKLLRYRVLADAKKIVPAQADALLAASKTIEALRKENAALKAASGIESEESSKGKGKGK